MFLRKTVVSEYDTLNEKLNTNECANNVQLKDEKNYQKSDSKSILIYECNQSDSDNNSRRQLFSKPKSKLSLSGESFKTNQVKNDARNILLKSKNKE